MAPYDDSDSESDVEYTETNVLLGYASTDSNGEEVSRLGGTPDWIDPSHPPSARLARCKVCNDLMVLLLQLNGELPGRFPGHERRLYVFSCRRRSCRRKEGCVRALRGVRVSEELLIEHKKQGKQLEEAEPKKEVKASELGLGESIFGVKPSTGGTAKANPFMTGSGSGSGGNPFTAKPSGVNPFGPAKPASSADTPETKEITQNAADALPKTFAETLSLNNPQQPVSHGPAPPPEPWPTSPNDLPKPYPVRWLSDAEYEALDPTPPPVTQNTAAVPMELDNDDSSGGGGQEDKETYESNMDTTFQKFADIVGQNPEQCIRYEFGGQPLLYSKADAVGKLLKAGGPGMPRCSNCGANRVFEVQLTPHAIEQLESEEDNDIAEGMDWGTIIVGVCEKDCTERGQRNGETGYVEEWAGVQWEELTVKR